jgi:glucose-6-phosphate isomerase
VATRLWDRDVALFAPDGASKAVQHEIGDRLGWLDAAVNAGKESQALTAFARECAGAGLRDVYLLGMGGSSLCAEVLRDAGPAGPMAARLTVLDTTDERAIGDITAALDPSRALFIVASKSGSTIEVSALERHFWKLMSDARGGEAGAHFVAITDPGSPLEPLAASRHYRRTFLNPPDIGGRYSALSLFGLVPAALLGLDLAQIAASARAMADACRRNDDQNPGLVLGAFLGHHALAGRDKLTIATSPEFASLGPWIEQLVAESTGKIGLGILPVIGEVPADAADYGNDRVFVSIRAEGDHALDHWEHELREAHHPLLRIESSVAALGGEFFRWEFATAVAGYLLGVNPFDQPDVQAAKVATARQIQSFLETGLLRLEPSLQTMDSHRRRTHARSDPTSSGGYIAILDYLPFTSEGHVAMSDLARRLREISGQAVTVGRGPRYLHSTGQYHKGGPNTGRFVLVTTDDETITLVPETAYSFSVLKHAQALGDFDALAAADREVLHLHFPNPSAEVMPELTRLALEWARS